MVNPDKTSDNTARTGTVITNYGKEIIVEDPAGTRHRCIARKNLPTTISGDKVHWQPQAQGHGSIIALLPRRSTLTMHTKDGKQKIVAANVDTVGIVCAAEPAFQLDLLDRYLLACEIAKIKPIILFNKSDLYTPAQLQQCIDMLSLYTALHYPVFFLSTKTGAGIESLREHLSGVGLIFVGQSGVGKSSLIRTLIPSSEARVAQLDSVQGRHTTTHTELYHLPHGGYLIDSPGVRAFGLTPVDNATLAQAFVEFRPYLDQCRFQDCSHLQEPGCAIKAAVEKGLIASSRYERFKSILASFPKPAY
jgi:ribosome biogenesis GTPase